MKLIRYLKYELIAVVVLLTLIGWSFAGADHGIKKGGHDLYWKNRIALADDGAFINDSLVPSFLGAEESLPIDTNTGEFIIGSERRAYSPDRQIGWLLRVTQKADVISGYATPDTLNENRQINKIYGIKTHLVFDLRTEGKK